MVAHPTTEPAGAPSVVVCPDKFRGSLSAREASAVVARAFRRAGAEVTELPLSDGGEGFLEILAAHHDRRDGAGRPDRVEIVTTTVEGPHGEWRDVRWGLRADGVAIVEAALACGHPPDGLAGADRDPERASTRGVGQVLAAARAAGARRALVGIGGTVTTDGGMGALEALGWTTGAMELVVAVDTRTRYLDAARVFGPQKGADAEAVARLSERLVRDAAAVLGRTGVDLRVHTLPGTGAGGGLAGGLHALGGVLRPGIEVVAEASGLEGHLHAADLVVTGEGRLDPTSVDGKAVGWVLDRARPGHRALVVGAADLDVVEALPADVQVRVLRDRAVDDADSMGRAAELLADAAESLAAELAGVLR